MKFIEIDRVPFAVKGGGQVWDNVYGALQPYGVAVLGGRVTGVAVAGFTLGDGYGWKSNQYGLTVDTVLEYEVRNIIRVDRKVHLSLF